MKDDVHMHRLRAHVQGRPRVELGGACLVRGLRQGEARNGSETVTERDQMIIAFGNVFEKMIIDMGGMRSTAAFVKAYWLKGLHVEEES